MTRREDVYDVATYRWCELCGAAHWPCEFGEYGQDIGAPDPTDDEVDDEVEA